jgi:alcohol dehydrogenase
MRCYRLDDSKGFDGLRLHHEEMEKPQRGEVLVKVHAVSLNYRDVSLAMGTYVWNARRGLVPCSDAAGEIVEVGEGVTAYKAGDRVISTFHPRWFGGRPPFSAAADTYGNGRDGWLTEYKVVSQEAVVLFPSILSWEEGSTLPCAGLTAWNALSGPSPIRPGNTVLTLGTGGVSVFAVQLAKALGASVIGTTSSERKAEVLMDLGVSQIVNYSRTNEWGQYIKKALTGGVGVDAVVEVGGPATISESLHAVRWGGEVVLIGYLTRDNPGVDYFHMKRSGALLRPIGTGDRSQLEDLVRAVQASGVKPLIDRVFAFNEAAQAFAYLHSAQHVGKVVIRLAS